MCQREHRWTHLLLKLAQGRAIPNADTRCENIGTNKSSGCLTAHTLLTQPLRKRDLHCLSANRLLAMCVSGLIQARNNVESGYYYFHFVREADTQKLGKLPEAIALISLVEEPGSKTRLARLEHPSTCSLLEWSSVRSHVVLCLAPHHFSDIC